MSSSAHRNFTPAAVAAAFVAAFGLLIASFPARNADLWRHLADGRGVAEGQFSRLGGSWLTDLGSYAVWSALGGWGLVGLKAVVVAVTGLFMLRAARTSGPWWLTAACVAFALMVVGGRVLLQPVTVSYLFLAAAVCLLHTPPTQPQKWFDWRQLALFWVWANADRWFVVGLVVVAAHFLGECIAQRGVNTRRLAGVLATIGVCLLTPVHVNGFGVLTELRPVAVEGGGPGGVGSPFEMTYLTALTDSPAAMAYFPLLVLSGVSFAGVRRSWQWDRFMPWLAVAVLSAVSVRVVPFFAVVAGPVLAWNLQEVLARRTVRPLRRSGKLVFAGLVGFGAVGLLVVAWPGWLQGPSFYGPRRWAVVHPAGVERAAGLLTNWKADGRTLHVSSDTADAFAWFAPDDDATTDDALLTKLLGDAEGRGADEKAVFDTLRAKKIDRVVVSANLRGRSADVLVRLFADPIRWPLLNVRGGVAVFGWRDPAGNSTADPYTGREVDLNRLAFAPTEEEQAPAPPPSDPPAWWEAFARSASGRGPDRDEATLLRLRAEADKLTAPLRLEAEWQLAEIALAGGAGGYLAPEESLRQFVRTQGDVPPAVLFAGVRAGRRAVAAHPDDAAAYALLGRFYIQLMHWSGERSWALTYLGRLRQVQAAAALNRAVLLNPSLAQARLDLGVLYQELGCLDLSVEHLQRYRELVARSKEKPHPKASDDEMARLEKELARRRKQYDEQSARGSAADRANLAVGYGLADTALTLLLKSDVSAIGIEGVKLQLDLMLRTGRGRDVIAWVGPDLKEPLGGAEYHWVRAQAHLAGGDYTAADAELAQMLRDQPTAFGVIADPYTPAQAVGLAAQLVAEGMLAQRPGENTWEAFASRILGEEKFQGGLNQLVEVIANQNNVTALRGMVALEAGNIAAARRQFEVISDFTTDRTAQGPLAPAHAVAARGLGWLNAVK